jgi:dipeptidyl aminopeptidase/acylaminoacyl peptidase
MPGSEGIVKRLFILVMLSITAAAGHAQLRRPMTPEDLYRIPRVRDPQVSPDGLHIAFTVGHPDFEANEIDTDIWLMPAAGGEPRRLTHGPGADHSPRWSPDGSWLAFVSDRSGTANLYLIPVDGGEARRLTDSDTDLYDPVWARNGRHMLCGSRVVPSDLKPEKRENWTVEDLPESKARSIDRLLFRQWDRWLGDERNHLFLVDVDDGLMTDLTPGLFDTPPVSLAGGQDFDIAPDGGEVCFVKNEDPDSAMSTDHNLYLLDLGSNRTRRITVGPGRDSQPHYSPDGRFIAYTSMKAGGYEADNAVLTLHDRQTGSRRSLTEEVDVSVRALRWAPDSTSLFFTARHQGRLKVFAVDLEGVVHNLVSEGYTTYLSPAPDGSRLIIVRSRSHLPAELYSVELGTGSTTRLTRFTAAAVEEIDLPQLEEFWFEGAEGTEVHGFVQRPPGFDPKLEYPAVLVIHGGPQGMWADRFMGDWFTFPLVSAPGYVGLFLNPRGSEGYGSEFRAQVSRDYGGRCYQDLMKGLDAAIERFPFIDSDRLAVAGGSFGGYSVNWIIGHTDRFLCAISHAGLYNLTSFFGATEELWFATWDMGDSPWEDPELYAKWSPHHSAGRFKTPTLVTHGELDYRVPFAESLQLFTALQFQDIPSRLVVFPDEGHVIEKPQNNVRWWREMHRWLEIHLRDRVTEE